MKSTTVMMALMGLVAAEVPQEHSHEAHIIRCNQDMQLVNTLEIQDCIFALLGNAAASEGQGLVTNTDCLQMETADQAFTNAKNAGDVDGMVNALIYRTLERNTGSVGLASVLCNETAVNPEIAALTQHQDPASPEAEGNKQLELDLAIQIASVGGDPQLALQSATFEPGEIGDPTAAGNTCNELDDPAGCIFTLNLDAPLVTPEEIDAAVAAAGGAAAGAAGKGKAAKGKDAKGKDAKAKGAAGKGKAAEAGQAAAEGCAAAGAGAAAGAAEGKNNAADAKKNNAGKAGNAGAAGAAAGAAAGQNVQAFDGALGGAAAPAVTFTEGADRPFEVNGATFLNQGAALTRSCDIQNNACSNLANSGQLDGGVGQCQEQQQECLALAQAAKKLRRSRIVRSAAHSASRKVRRQSNFGSCDSPAIEFDGERFAGVNQGDFNHGSALNINIITSFNCQRLGSPCDAPQDVQDLCLEAADAAQALEGQAAADEFNSILGA